MEEFKKLKVWLKAHKLVLVYQKSIKNNNA